MMFLFFAGHRNDVSSNVNVRAALIHVIGDLLQSVAVLIVSIILYFKVIITVDLKLYSSHQNVCYVTPINQTWTHGLPVSMKLFGRLIFAIARFRIEARSIKLVNATFESHL